MYSEGICVLIALERHGISSLYPTNRRKGGGGQKQTVMTLD